MRAVSLLSPPVIIMMAAISISPSRSRLSVAAWSSSPSDCSGSEFIAVPACAASLSPSSASMTGASGRPALMRAWRSAASKEVMMSASSSSRLACTKGGSDTSASLLSVTEWVDRPMVRK